MSQVPQSHATCHGAEWSSSIAATGFGLGSQESSEEGDSEQVKEMRHDGPPPGRILNVLQKMRCGSQSQSTAGGNFPNTHALTQAVAKSLPWWAEASACCMC